MRHIEVVAAVIEHDGKILCMERDQGKYDYVSFKWEFPGGKIEEGESKEEALKRELREEMEMDVEVVSHFLDVYHEYPDFTMNMYAFSCKALIQPCIFPPSIIGIWIGASLPEYFAFNASMVPM